MSARLGGMVAASLLALSAAAPGARADLSDALNPFGAYYNNIPRAAKANDVGKIRSLLDDGTSPNQTDEDGKTTGMHVAARTGNLQIMAILYKAGANINERDAVGSTPLDYAAEHGHLDALKLLLDMGAKVDAENQNGMTPLMFAAKSGDIEALRALLAHGANPNKLDYTGRDAASWARESHRPAAAVFLTDAARKH
jgi:ankyrin repeat protein